MGKALSGALVGPDLKARISRRLRELGRGPVKAARIAGLERNFIRDLITGRKRSVYQEAMGKVAKGLDWTLADLLGQELDIQLERLESDNVEIPEIDVRAGASYGGGVASEDESLDEEGTERVGGPVRSRWGVPAPFLRNELRVRAGRAHILPIRGDSMIDTLYDGDRAIIDLDDTDVSQGGIFALLDDNGTLIIKQVELIRAGGPKRILCTSRNPRYKPFELPLHEPVRIIGRVASKITRI